MRERPWGTRGRTAVDGGACLWGVDRGLVRRAQMPPHARRDGANPKSCPANRFLNHPKSQGSLSAGRRDSRRAVHQRAGESGSQPAPYGHHAGHVGAGTETRDGMLRRRHRFLQRHGATPRGPWGPVALRLHLFCRLQIRRDHGGLHRWLVAHLDLARRLVSLVGRAARRRAAVVAVRGAPLARRRPPRTAPRRLNLPQLALHRPPRTEFHQIPRTALRRPPRTEVRQTPRTEFRRTPRTALDS